MQDHDKPALFMSCPINAILEGFYETNTTMADLKAKGDFGIGTFNDLDGELVLLDGTVYQLDVDGNAHPVADDQKTPFACACPFDPISEEAIPQAYSHEAFHTFLRSLLPSPNMLYAIRVDGLFKSVRTRSVPRTQNYTPLVEATAKQVESTFEDTEGTLVGFYTPSFVPSVNVPGFHFHFLSADRSRGGHLLQSHVLSGTVSIQFYTRLDLNLPLTLDYLSAEFQRDAEKDLEKAER
jgi:acetolactate decarboxylase